MPRFEFEEVCTSRPIYEIDALTLEEAVDAFNRGKAWLRSEEVEENYLVEVRQDGVPLPLPK